VAGPTLDARSWWKTGTGARRMAIEYSKYLAVFGREALLHLGAKADGDSAKRDAKPAS
jgi:hypothetical protein